MKNFSRIGEALKYIDAHLDEPVTLEALAEKYYLSPFYFHKVFSSIVGKPLAAYIRDRRVLYACKLLCTTKKTILDIALDCGFQSHQSFARAFRRVQGVSPGAYRARGDQPDIISADDLIVKFTNRLQGGIFVVPSIIKRGRITVAGTCGGGNRTWEVWSAFEKLSREKPLPNALPGGGYEIRVYEGEKCTVYAGCSVSSVEDIDAAYSIFELPASRYASFDVYAAMGYESENSAMDQWLETNGEGYVQRPLKDGAFYCVEYYDERFDGGEAGSIVEIWVPIEKKP